MVCVDLEGAATAMLKITAVSAPVEAIDGLSWVLYGAFYTRYAWLSEVLSWVGDQSGIVEREESSEG